GLGHWGPILVRAIASNPLARVGTVCDLDETRLTLVKRNIPSVQQTSIDSLATLSDPGADAVIIATPTKTHYALVKAALDAGKHVLVEKPLTLDVGESTELVELAHQKGLILAVGHVFLFNKGVQVVGELIRSGELGSINYIFATRTNLGPFRTDCNALWDLASHDLSIINHWLEANPVSVTARGQAFLNPPIEDVVVANYTYPGGVLAGIHASWLNPSKVRQITVVGQKKMAIFDDMNVDAPVKVFSKSVDVQSPSQYVDSFGSFRMSIRQGDVVIPHIAGGEPVANQLAHFIDCIMNGKSPINEARIALEVVRQLASAEESMKNHSTLIEIR
ncbi:MAG: Gfo/Idh/MocA family protein, partial [bacterium]